MWPVPFTRKEILSKAPKNPLKIEIGSEYNFYHKAYESHIDNFGASHGVLPNLLLTILERNARDNDRGTFSEKAIPDIFKELEDHITGNYLSHSSFVTLNGKITTVFNDIYLTEEKKIKTGDQDTQNYFTAWTEVIKRTAWDPKTGPKGPKWFADKYKNQLHFPLTWSGSSTEIKQLKQFFPMMINLRFTPMTKSSTDNALINILTNPPEGGIPMWYGLLRLWLGAHTDEFRNVSALRINTDRPLENRSYLTNPVLPEYDFYNFLEHLDPEILSTPLHQQPSEDGLKYLHGYDPRTQGRDKPSTNIPPLSLILPKSADSKMWTAISVMTMPIGDEGEFPTGPFEDALAYTMEDFQTRFTQLVREKTRPYSHILAGHMAHTEVLYWKISKHFADENGHAKSKAIQNYYYLNTPGADEIELLDTQVRYDKPYVYKIAAITAVFGTEYEYVSPKTAVKTVHSWISLEDYNKYYKKNLTP